jgi:hypothetical protein
MINDVCPNCKGTGKINNPRIHFVAFSLADHNMYQIMCRLEERFADAGRLVSVVHIPAENTVYFIFDREGK